MLATSWSPRCIPLELTWEDETLSRSLGVPNLPLPVAPGEEKKFHYEFTRPLGFGNPVTSMTFSPCGRWLFTGATSGITKVWEVVRWAEVARLRGVRDEAITDVLVSPSQQWLVSVQMSGLCIFQCAPPWRLESKVPAAAVCLSMMQDPLREPVWRVAAFAPALGDSAKPVDTQFAAMSSTHLVVLDCAKGLKGPPRRTHSYSSASTACCLVYTSCASWIVCGYEDGRFEVWDAFQLAISKAVRAHVSCITCLVSTPRSMDCVSHIVSAGADGRVKLWPSTSWRTEQAVIDKLAGVAGIRDCAFALDGAALVSVAREVCVWATEVNGKGHLGLTLHQRLEASVSAQGLCILSLCRITQVLVVGSIDGGLGIWQRRHGCPPKWKREAPAPVSKEEEAPISKPYRPMTASTRAKQMRKVSAVGLVEQDTKSISKPLPARAWNLSTSMARPTSSSGEKRRSVSAAGHRSFAAESSQTLAADTAGLNPMLAWQVAPTQEPPMQRHRSSPELLRSQPTDLGRWSAKRFEFEAVFGRPAARAF
mmetsp:Transcript_23395/g.43040  ORF Transcript_23395/g.43040 Transcript_23395/m.43040 type:complete len:537 (-) Transcript_23395:144-1754(-)